MQISDIRSSNEHLHAEVEKLKETTAKLELELDRVRASESKKKDLEAIDIENMKQLVQSNIQAVTTIDSFMKKYGSGALGGNGN